MLARATAEPGTIIRKGLSQRTIARLFAGQIRSCEEAIVEHRGEGE
jgi:hypothetical protein